MEFWRLGFALAGTLGYWLLYRPDWRNPFLLLYDVPTLLLSFSCGGQLLGYLIREKTPIPGIHLLLLLIALVFAFGAQYRAWPLSGHLTVALTAGILEASEAWNLAWLRGSALLPAAVLVLIRTFWPQSDLMARRLNTALALGLGGLLGMAGVAVRVWSRG